MMNKMIRRDRIGEDAKNFLLDAKLERLGISQNGENYVIPIQ